MPKPRTGKKCHWCKARLDHSKRFRDDIKGVIYLNKATRDHVDPKYKGGTTMVWCCWACNNLKGEMPAHTWVALMEAFEAHGFPKWRHLARRKGPRGLQLVQAAIELGLLPDTRIPFHLISPRRMNNHE